jgi:spore coat protein H
LYKAVDFDFARHEDVIVQPTDARYSAEAFEALLDPKGSKDYSGLIAMLDAVNDLSIPIQDTVDRYFDEESLYSWLAINLLLDNRDTDTENYYLYRPLGSERFYIIPWDYDSALRDDYEVLRDANYSAGWEKGIFLYTKSVLFRRIMESEYCSNELSEYITALHDSVFSARNVYRRARKLADTVLDYLYELPDKSYARVTEANYKRLLELIQDQVDRNFYTYYDTLMTPWPFHILDPEEDEDGRVTLRWEATQAMNQQVTYSLELDTGWDFSDPVLKAVDYEGTSYSAGELAPGQYFLRITAKSEQGYTQEAYEVYNTEKKTTVHGVLCFYIQEVDED